MKLVKAAGGLRWAGRQGWASGGPGGGRGPVLHRTHRQTVSKPRFWSVRTLQTIDFVRPHFRKIDFSHSLALHLTAASVRSWVAPASGSR